MPKIQSLLVLLLLMLVSACTTKPPTPSILDSNQHQQALTQLTTWSIKGRFGFKSSEEKFSASMNWQQHKQRYNFRLSSFIGTTLMHMQGQPGFVELLVDDQTYIDKNPSALIARITGWNIPLDKLADWVKGLVHQQDIVQFNAEGLVTQLTPFCHQACEQWQVSYSDFKPNQQLWLPHRITLRNLDKPDNQIKIRISQWTTD